MPASDASAFVDFWKSAAPAAIGVFGVFVGGLIQLVSTYFAADLQRRHRVADEKAARQREMQGRESQRNFVRALIARHLEAFARQCASAMWHNGNPEEEGAAKVPDLPEWPPLAWDLLDANEMVEIRDIEVRVDILRDSTEGAVFYGASHIDEARKYYAEGAATIGLEAWRMAQRLRASANIEPFRFPKQGANYAEALEEHVEALENRVREADARRAARRAAAGGEDFL